MQASSKIKPSDVQPFAPAGCSVRALDLDPVEATRTRMLDNHHAVEELDNHHAVEEPS